MTTRGENYRPKWSPNGSRLSYIHEAAAGKDLWVMSANGSGKRQVTTLGNVTTAGSWSPDGATLAFAAGDNVEWAPCTRSRRRRHSAAPRR
jgi:Tol biopolymer transport system component